MERKKCILTYCMDLFQTSLEDLVATAQANREMKIDLVIKSLRVEKKVYLG
ncbi:hypothetical protein HV081_18420 [Enterobacter roggenkampii]|uniref:hypothetical protein n=1 Tax=Enterobacter roggenkampii TaxID=1812935 RepID=UPI0015E57BCB|nr:hypothetical protein [Enterobacter roggenkampii]QLN69741.1 hypothetical protein HV081_18420 [Enterobacter roggenkampii]